MSEAAAAEHQRAAIQRMMRRLDGFARGLGLDEAAMRLIVEQAVADMLQHADDERLAWARKWMVAAASA